MTAPRLVGEYLFMDCSPQSPVGRRSVCYDRQAREARKKHPPTDSAVEMAAAVARFVRFAHYVGHGALPVWNQRGGGSSFRLGQLYTFVL